MVSIERAQANTLIRNGDKEQLSATQAAENALNIYLYRYKCTKRGKKNLFVLVLFN